MFENVVMRISGPNGDKDTGVRLAVFTAVTMKNAVFWDVPPMWLL
jgi:hypothetical protein